VQGAEEEEGGYEGGWPAQDDRHSGSDDREQTLTPGSAMPQSPHLGAVAFFLRWWYTSRPPGVFTIRRLAEVVLYGLGGG
jgi:hypothetical protein